MLRDLVERRQSDDQPKKAGSIIDDFSFLTRRARAGPCLDPQQIDAMHQHKKRDDRTNQGQSRPGYQPNFAKLGWACRPPGGKSKS
jgi:hypothetical protein